jgi:hypothetical protein
MNNKRKMKKKINKNKKKKVFFLYLQEEIPDHFRLLILLYEKSFLLEAQSTIVPDETFPCALVETFKDELQKVFFSSVLMEKKSITKERELNFLHKKLKLFFLSFTHCIFVLRYNF